MASLPGQPGTLATGRLKPNWILMKPKDGAAMASAEPYANHLHLASDR